MNLKEIPDLSEATNLEELDLFGCKSLKKIPDLSKNTSLKDVNVSLCENLEEIPDISKNTYLEVLNAEHCLKLEEIPDISNGTNLKVLNVSFCESLKKIPDLSKARNITELNLVYCTSLEVLPTIINLVSLTSLDLSGCSLLKSFPQLSININELILHETAIEEVPSWIENLARLKRMSMTYCRQLRKISAAIWNLKLLEKADFEGCGVVTSISDAEKIEHNMEELISRVRCSSHAEFIFTDCFSLNSDAHEFIQSHSRVAILPGNQVPTYFTHRTCGTSLRIPLPQSCSSQQNFGFMACIIADPVTCFLHTILVHWKFRGVTGTSNISPIRNWRMDHLVVSHVEICPGQEVSDHPSQMDCCNVEFEFKIMYDDWSHGRTSLPPHKIKGCGLRVFNVSPSLVANDRSSKTEYNHTSRENIDTETFIENPSTS